MQCRVEGDVVHWRTGTGVLVHWSTGAMHWRTALLALVHWCSAVKISVRTRELSGDRLLSFHPKSDGKTHQVNRKIVNCLWCFQPLIPLKKMLKNVEQLI